MKIKCATTKELWKMLNTGSYTIYYKTLIIDEMVDRGLL